MQKLVLVAEDHQDTREMLCEVLEFHGYRTAQAADGAAAVQAAHTERPAAILMDVAMPIMDGITATTELKRDDDTRDIPVIAVTGQGLEAQRAIRAAGASEVCGKPCDVPEILEHVRRAIGD